MADIPPVLAPGGCCFSGNLKAAVDPGGLFFSGALISLREIKAVSGQAGSAKEKA